MTTHPLLETFTRIRAISEYLEKLKLAPEGEAWVPLQTLLDPEATPVSEMLGRMSTRYKSKNKRLAPSFFFGDLAYILVTLTSSSYLVDRRVPRLTHAALWLTFDEHGYASAVALSDYGFAALPDDAAADHADCIVVPSEDALQDFLLEQLTHCLQPLTQSVRAQSSLGVPAMWALAADYLSSATTYVARMMKEDARGLALARQLAAKPTPLRRKRDFIEIEESGLTFNLVERVSCCLYYDAEDGHYCSSCPHRPKEERVDLIRKWLAETATQQKVAS